MCAANGNVKGQLNEGIQGPSFVEIGLLKGDYGFA
jgi:hypothetical protein